MSLKEQGGIYNSDFQAIVVWANRDRKGGGT
jgi:hypothetical protein